MSTNAVSVSQFFLGYMSADDISDIIADHQGDLGAASEEIAAVVAEVLSYDPESIPTNLDEIAYDACVAVFGRASNSALPEEQGELTVEKLHEIFSSLSAEVEEEENPQTATTIQALFNEQRVISAELRVAHYAKIAATGDRWHMANLRRAELELADALSDARYGL
jgi:hypothetical protein